MQFPTPAAAGFAILIVTVAAYEAEAKQARQIVKVAVNSFLIETLPQQK